jgi:Domain of unknown function (DUF222)
MNTTTRDNTDDLVKLLVGLERMVRAMNALGHLALSTLARHWPYEGDPAREAGVKVARALRISERTAQNRVAEAVTLTRLFPETLDRLAAGAVQPAQVRALIKVTAPLDDATARKVQDLVLPRMPAQKPATTRKALNRAVIEADPSRCRPTTEAPRQVSAWDGDGEAPAEALAAPTPIEPSTAARPTLPPPGPRPVDGLTRLLWLHGKILGAATRLFGRHRWTRRRPLATHTRPEAVHDASRRGGQPARRPPTAATTAPEAGFAAAVPLRTPAPPPARPGTRLRRSSPMPAPVG